MHCHIITPEFLSALRSEGRLMDEAGVQTSVLTLAAPQPVAEAAAVTRQCNEAAAQLKQQHPGRFLFCAALPLPDIDAAIREAVYALDTPPFILR